MGQCPSDNYASDKMNDKASDKVSDKPGYVIDGQIHSHDAHGLSYFFLLLRKHDGSLSQVDNQ